MPYNSTTDEDQYFIYVVFNDTTHEVGVGNDNKLIVYNQTNINSAFLISNPGVNSIEGTISLRHEDFLVGVRGEHVTLFSYDSTNAKDKQLLNFFSFWATKDPQYPVREEFQCLVGRCDVVKALRAMCE